MYFTNKELIIQGLAGHMDFFFFLMQVVNPPFSGFSYLADPSLLSQHIFSIKIFLSSLLWNDRIAA